MSLEETLFIAVPLEIFEESFTVQHKENTKKLRECLWVLMSFPQIKNEAFSNLEIPATAIVYKL